MGEMKRTPRPQCFKDGAKSLTVGGYLVLHLKSRFRPHASGHEIVTFEFAQLLPQNLDRDSGHSPSKFAKT